MVGFFRLEISGKVVSILAKTFLEQGFARKGKKFFNNFWETKLPEL